VDDQYKVYSQETGRALTDPEPEEKDKKGRRFGDIFTTRIRIGLPDCADHEGASCYAAQ
jgi:hypothetical protein